MDADDLYFLWYYAVYSKSLEGDGENAEVKISVGEVGQIRAAKEE